MRRTLFILLYKANWVLKEYDQPYNIMTLTLNVVQTCTQIRASTLHDIYGVAVKFLTHIAAQGTENGNHIYKSLEHLNLFDTNSNWR